MNNLWKIALKNVLPVVVILGLLVLGIGWLDNYSKKHVEKKMSKLEVSDMKQQAIDSVKSEDRKHEKASIDSVNALRTLDRQQYSTKINRTEAKCSDLTKKLQVKEQDYETDTTQHTIENCDSIRQIQKQIIANKDTTIQSVKHNNESLNLSLTDANKKYFIQVEETDQCKRSNETANKTIGILTNELKKKTGWWARNEKWLFLGAGAIGSYLVVK